MAIDYFVQNPDVAAAYRANSYGLTPELFASFHYTNYGQAEAQLKAMKIGAGITSNVEIRG